MAPIAAGDCRYEGFLSYARVDERTAAWLHRALENFRIPRRTGAGRRRFRPFFRDQDELASSADLSETLHAALRDSASLIVLCSPGAAASRWVDEEVRAFRSLGRADRIYCVLTGGDPNQPAGVFPPALREAGVPLAVDLRDFRRDRRAALLRLAAALLGVEFDVLRQRHRQRTRRRWSGYAGMATASVAVVAVVTYQVATAPPCTGSGERFAEVWNDDERAAIRERFMASGLPYAQDSWTRVENRLTEYAGEWISTHTDACAATRIREEQSERLMDLRMACLDDRRFAFDALVDTLRDADVGVLEQAVDAAVALPGLMQCSDGEQLEAGIPLPEEQMARERVAAARSAAIEAQTLLTTGKTADALARIAEAEAFAELIDYAPVETEILIIRGLAEARTGASDSARSTLYLATSEAVRARDQELIARAWLALSELLVDFRDRIDEALDVLEVARSYVMRLPPEHPQQASFHHVRGTAMLRASRFEEALADLQRAVALARETGSPELAEYLLTLTWAHASRHETDEAERFAAEALDLTRATVGQSHPSYASALIEAARIDTMLGNAADALTSLEEAVSILRAAHTDNNPTVSFALGQLGWVLRDNGRFADGIEVMERALEIENGFEKPRLRMVASLHNGIGDIHVSLGDLDRAESHLQQALTAWSELGPGVDVGVGLNNLGNLANRKGDHVAAEDYCRRALDNDAAYFEGDHPQLAFPLTCLGEALLGQQRAGDALEPLARAETLRDRPDMSLGMLAWTRWLYGRALFESGSDRERGLAYVRASREIFAEMGDAAVSELTDVDLWLSARAR